ncbi:hypothetical protein PISL3812_07279 [Talaromyces islandicus]|uniref:Uncharacterized protein n=1 Tax=Talaromyces islandicus TaxID=28573 RepID=A0A0U1M5H9_TALIS|nr:hypothetical protein PISL3812_07279 [Talaromyces islandicus]
MPPQRTTKGGKATRMATRTSPPILVPWRGVFYKTIDAPATPTREDRIAMRDTVLEANQHAIFDKRERRFGNVKGMALISSTEELVHHRDQRENDFQRLWEHYCTTSAQLQSCQQRVRILEKHFCADLLNIRKKVLYDAGKLAMVGRPRHERNAAAHGGNVLGDIEALEQQIEFKPHEVHVIEACSAGFKQLYEISFDCHRKILEAKNDDRLMALFNLRGNMRTCSPWKQSPGSEILSWCNAILKKWHSEPSSWYEPEVVAMVDELLAWANDWD